MKNLTQGTHFLHYIYIKRNIYFINHIKYEKSLKFKSLARFVQVQKSHEIDNSSIFYESY